MEERSKGCCGNQFIKSSFIQTDKAIGFVGFFVPEIKINLKNITFSHNLNVDISFYLLDRNQGGRPSGTI
ncbi:hypothetical protein CEH09_07625 [Listeria monocytogenes]|nr:hypothetical protein [Listeria monocytogenes]EBD1472859.1 hypothetical protein [Listeria monocytogenes]EBI2478083.1 hypothetical protein [Listeria monocytogenes]MDC40340.1 hypothetical protein [Listeria monocytogenes]